MLKARNNYRFPFRQSHGAIGFLSAQNLSQIKEAQRDTNCVLKSGVCDSWRKSGDYWREYPISEENEMITRILIAAALVLSCGLCMAEDLPQNANGIKTLTAKQAAELVAKFDGHLSLDDLTSIDKDVAQELAKVKRILRLDRLTSIDKYVAQELAKSKSNLYLGGLTSISKDVAKELVKFEGYQLSLNGLTSIDKYVAQELAKFKGLFLSLDGLTSSDKDVLKILKSNKSIILPEKYSDKKD